MQCERGQTPTVSTTFRSTNTTTPCLTLRNLTTSTRNVSLSVKGACSKTHSKHHDVYSFHFWQNHPKSPLAIRHYEPLMAALEYDDISGSKRLIQLIVDESSSKTLKWLSSLHDEDGNTLAHCAATSDRKSCAQSMLGLLCKFGVHLNGVNKDGISPLDIVAMHGDVQWLREIIEMGGSSRIHRQQLMEMKDHDVTRWLTEYQDAVRANGYTQRGAVDATIDGQHSSHRLLPRHRKSRKRSLDDNGKGTTNAKGKREPDRKRNILRIASLSTVAVEESKNKRLSRFESTQSGEAKENSLTPPSCSNAIISTVDVAPNEVPSTANETESASSKPNVFAVMERVNRFKNKLKDKVEDAQHAQTLSKEAPIERANGKRSKRKKGGHRSKDWSIQRLRREVYRLKGKLPYFQKYGRHRPMIDYGDLDRVQCASIEAVRDHLGAKHSGFSLNVLCKADVLKLEDVFAEIDANGNGTVFLSELAAYYQLLTVSNGLYNAAHAMDDVKVLLQIMKLLPDKDGMTLTLWLNLWNLISINFGPLFVDEMLTEYAMFKQHVQGLNPHQKSDRVKNQNNRNKRVAATEPKRRIDSIRKAELCMLFDV